jgi:hypothetical protein
VSRPDCLLGLVGVVTAEEQSRVDFPSLLLMLRWWPQAVEVLQMASPTVCVAIAALPVGQANATGMVVCGCTVDERGKYTHEYSRIHCF